MAFITREKLIEDFFQELNEFLIEQVYYNNKWISCSLGEFYVRKRSLRVTQHGEKFKALDFANLNVFEKYRGNGIFTDILDAAVNMTGAHDGVFIESIANDGFYDKLIEKGWTPSKSSTGWDRHVYKLRTQVTPDCEQTPIDLPPLYVD